MLLLLFVCPTWFRAVRGNWKKGKRCPQDLAKMGHRGRARPLGYHFDAWTCKFHPDVRLSCVCMCVCVIRGQAFVYLVFWKEELICGKIMLLDVSSV